MLGFVFFINLLFEQLLFRWDMLFSYMALHFGFFFFWFAVVFLLLLFDTGMVLKRDWTGRSDRFNWEPAFNLVQLWAKTKNDLKTEEIRKPGSSTGESGTGMVEPVNDRLGFFLFFLA